MANESCDLPHRIFILRQLFQSKRRVMHLYIRLFILSGLGFCLAYGQIPAADQYAQLLSEVQLIKRYADNSDENTVLLDSARVYARDSLWEIASVFLEMYLEQKSNPVTPVATSLNNSQDIKSLQFRVISGLDFNRQEFELGLIQSDSVLKDQISKPFVGLEISKSGSAGRQTEWSLFSRFRADKENISAAARTQADYSTSPLHLFFEAGAGYDKNQLYPEFTFWEMHSSQRVHWQSKGEWSIRLENILRYKKYKKSIETVPGFINDALQAAINYSDHYYFNYTFELNESLNSDNLDYFEQTAFVQYFDSFFSIWRIYSQTGLRLNRFSYMLEDSLIHNKSVTSYFEIQSALSLGGNWQWKEYCYLKKKSFAVISEQDANHVACQLNSVLRQSLSNNWHWEAGHHFESKTHQTQEGGRDVLVREQNYYENGLLMGLDYQNTSGLFLSVDAAYSWRRYPHTVSGEELSLYSNRDVLSLSMFMLIPLSRSLDFHAIASYDNDRDKDKDEGNIQSSFFSIELQYKF